VTLCLSRPVRRDRHAAGEWEAHRVPLVEEIRTTKDSVAKRKSDMKYKLDRIKQMREDMKRLAVEIREKDELVKQLLEELGKLPKQVQRTGYTRRIMDIMKNIEKQQITISGILKDTRDTQKEINTVSEVLHRFLSPNCFLLHFPPPASPPPTLTAALPGSRPLLHAGR
jgi:chromosome segregation ATPase